MVTYIYNGKSKSNTIVGGTVVGIANYRVCIKRFEFDLVKSWLYLNHICIYKKKKNNKTKHI